MTARRVALYGFFGIQNIGNECTLQATHANARRFVPDAEIVCIALDPQRVTAEHGIRAFSIDQARGTSEPPSDRREGSLSRLLRLVFKRLPLEIGSFVRILQLVGRGTTLSVAGTGILEEDSASPSCVLNLLKWEIATRLRGGQVVFLSIGAGPIDSGLSRRLCRQALGMARYVSYRDEQSKRYMNGIGVNTDDHHVYPDLAFSLPREALPASRASASGLHLVGLGVVDDSKFKDAQHYCSYLKQLASFIVELVASGCSIRVLHGDGKHDERARIDLRRELAASGIRDDDPRVQLPAIRNTDDLLHQLADLDLVIASRYHNVILSLMMRKPVIALSYHVKFAALMDTFAMQDFCIELPDLDATALAPRFRTLSERLAEVVQAVDQKAQSLRAALVDQYARAFLEHLPESERRA